MGKAMLAGKELGGTMDQRVTRLNTPQDCAIFAENATARGAPELALEARLRSLQLRAKAHGAASEVEEECLAAVFAYEDTLAVKNGRRQNASRTWPMIRKLGILPEVERMVSKRKESLGFDALVAMGFSDFCFEAVGLRHPGHFSQEAIRISNERLTELTRHRRTS